MNPELYLFLAKLVVTALFALMMRRRGVRGRTLAVSTWVFFFGLFLTVMLCAHSLVILGLRIFESPEGAGPVYDFRLYALLLVGVVFSSQGVRYVRAARLLAAREPEGRREALRATLVVLALAAPLIPLQFFGLLMTAGALLTLGALALLKPAESTFYSNGRSVVAPAAALARAR
jgi:hypothetical protein